MSLLDRRKGISEAILKDRFIRQQLEQESVLLDANITSVMTRRGFRSSDWYDKRSSKVEGNNTMVMRHKPKHRFADMKTRNTQRGKIKKKSAAIHNKPIYGFLNNVIKRLHFGFTRAIQEELAKEI